MLSHAIPSTDRACAPSPTPRCARRTPARAPKGRAVDRFLSHFTNRFDAKGRISIPAAVPRGAGEGRLRGRLRPSLARRAGARLRRPRAVAEIDALLADDAALFAGRATPLRPRCLARARFLRPDSEGRVLLERAAEGVARPDGEAVFVGQGHKFQIWEPRRFREPSRGGEGSGAALAGGARSGARRGETPR